MAQRTKEQVELEEQILIEDHELGLHDEEVTGCPLCEEEEEIDPSDPRPLVRSRNPINAGSGRSWKGSTKEMSLVINNIDIIADLRAGVSPGNLSERVEMSRSKMRRAVDKKFGAGTYASLRDASKRPVTKEEKKEHREHDKRRDKGVPRIPSARIDDGWTYRNIYVNYGGRRLKHLPSFVAHDPSVAEFLLTSPEGEEYVRARNDEAADLIVDKAAEKLGLDPVRLRRFETSFMHHLVEKNEKMVKRGEASLKRRRTTKRKGGL